MNWANLYQHIPERKEVAVLKVFDVNDSPRIFATWSWSWSSIMVIIKLNVISTSALLPSFPLDCCVWAHHGKGNAFLVVGCHYCCAPYIEQLEESKNDIGLTSPVWGKTSFLVKSHLHPPVLLPFRLFSILHLKGNKMKQRGKNYGIWRNFRRADKRALVSQQR